jgi:hypothetical protein
MALMPVETRKTTIRLPAQLIRQLRHYAIEADTSDTAVIREAVEMYLAAHRDKDGNWIPARFENLRPVMYRTRPKPLKVLRRRKRR